MRRTVLVTFCLALVAAIGVVFTRTIAARVPQQRATLEKLIADRTGLAVRFDNVHFAWNLDGTSAVFTRVQLTDPKANRVRVVAPELRVKFDTWDFLRHQQFSLGHVTLASPEIEITGDPEALPRAAVTGTRKTQPAPRVEESEAALLRRYTSWMELMPIGSIEVEGARVHLKYRGEGRAHHTFTLSQAAVSRSASTFSAWGTMLLAQDVGQSLFVSTKVEGLAPGSQVSGELRVIARRIFLDRLAIEGVDGRGTFDAKLLVRNGRLDSATWQASARELELRNGTQFDHLSVRGRLARDADDLLLDFTDLQLTRGDRLERALAVSARIALERGSTRAARTTITAERLPFMAGELLAALAASRMADALPAIRGDWQPVVGELRDVRFDTGAPKSASAWTFSAQLGGAELTRPDHARIAQLTARLRFDASALRIEFDPANTFTLQAGATQEARAVSLAGTLTLATDASRSLELTDFAARTGATRIAVSGTWSNARAAQRPGATLAITMADVDRALVNDVWTLFAGATPAPALLASLAAGKVVAGTLELMPVRDAQGVPDVDWARSRGKLALAQISVVADDAPPLTEGHGAFAFARGAAQLTLASGRIEELTVNAARLDWPRTGEPRLHAALAGPLDAPLLRRALGGQGLERLRGHVTLEADARGERQLRSADQWRVTARLSEATLVLADGVPPVEKLAGTVRYAAGQLRALDFAGQWLGGPVAFQAQRVNGRGALNVALNGVADAAPLLRMLGQHDAAGRVNGQLAWNGTAQRLGANDSWRLTLASNLAGVESRFSEPFDKTRGRAMPVSADLRVDASGIRDFVLESARVSVRGEVRDDVANAKFSVLGVTGDLHRPADARAAAAVHVERLDLARAPALLAVAQALLPQDGNATLVVGDLRSGDRSLGELHAALARSEEGVRFDIESSEAAPHRIAAQGLCAVVDGRCRAQFTLDTQRLAALVRSARLPQEWPTESLHAHGELSWPSDGGADITRSLAGRFELEAQGSDINHQLVANASLADGQIQVTDLQGAGPDPTQIFRGSGRVSLVARDYDLTVDYERVSTLAASAMPTPARARLARAWNALRGSVARRGWTETPEDTRRVQWHGYFE